MTLEFSKIDFDGIGKTAGSPTLMWSHLLLAFRDTENDHHPSVELTLLLTRRPETTIAELELEARDRAKTILKEALAVVEANDLAALRGIADHEV